jgi:hypothetical protein
VRAAAQSHLLVVQGDDADAGFDQAAGGQHTLGYSREHRCHR